MRQALELALEALEEAWYHVGTFQPTEKAIDLYDEARAAIKEALAQPEQEPVGQLLEDAFGRGQVMWFNKPKDESMLYTTPPQRTWVGLTDEEIADCAEKMEASDPTDSFWREFFRGIEAKLKEKNT
jgi:plasmid stabilization system protein ParE